MKSMRAPSFSLSSPIDLTHCTCAFVSAPADPSEHATALRFPSSLSVYKTHHSFTFVAEYLSSFSDFHGMNFAP